MQKWNLHKILQTVKPFSECVCTNRTPLLRVSIWNTFTHFLKPLRMQLCILDGNPVASEPFRVAQGASYIFEEDK